MLDNLLLFFGSQTNYDHTVSGELDKTQPQILIKKKSVHQLNEALFVACEQVLFWRLALERWSRESDRARPHASSKESLLAGYPVCVISNFLLKKKKRHLFNTLTGDRSQIGRHPIAVVFTSST